METLSCRIAISRCEKKSTSYCRGEGRGGREGSRVGGKREREREREESYVIGINNRTGGKGPCPPPAIPHRSHFPQLFFSASRLRLARAGARHRLSLAPVAGERAATHSDTTHASVHLPAAARWSPPDTSASAAPSRYFTAHTTLRPPVSGIIFTTVSIAVWHATQPE